MSYTVEQVAQFSFEVDSNKERMHSIAKALREDLWLDKDDRKDLKDTLRELKARTAELTAIIENWINN